MTVNPVKIFGRGHSLCLQRLLEASLVEECFADVVLSTFSSTCSERKTVRGNKSVLAASSPFLNQLLRDVPKEEDAVIVFADYCQDDPGYLLNYVYTGQVACDSPEQRTLIENLLEELKIGHSQDSVNSIKQEARKQSNWKASKPLEKSRVKPNNLKRRKYRKVSTVLTERDSPYSGRPLEADRLEVTLEDPSEIAKQNEFMWNPDFNRLKSLLEKSSIKYDILPRIDKCSKSSIIDWPRLNDRLGIYFDSQLYSYYQGLVKSLPPIRIYLNIDDVDADQFDNFPEREPEIHRVQKPRFVYGRIKYWTQTRRKMFSGRLAAKEMCLVNGKRHLTLDGELQINPSIQLIDYPKTDQSEDPNGSNQEDVVSVENEENELIQQVIDEESRRKRVLLSTLSRLKKDFSHAKQVAREILKASKNVEDYVDEPTSFERKSCVSSTPKKSVQQVVCEVCGKLVTASWIRVHMANHQGEKNFLCEHCGRCFASSNLLKSHVHYQHNTNLDYVTCLVCSKTFSKKSRLEVHMRIHNGERPYECQECGKKFHTNGNLRKHIIVHSGEKPYKCHLCDKSFAQNTNLRLHLRIHQQLVEMGKSDVRVRKPEQVYRCDFCPMTFSRERHFYVHRCTHTGEKPALPCSDCQQKFPNINELKQHKLAEHPGTVHQCHFCDKSFFKKTANIRHMMTHTQGPPPKPSFQCHHCSAQFTTSAARTIHERTHTGERPFQCPNCDKTFSSKYNFRQHLRMHSDERPFKCTSCTKAFRQPQHLRAHSYIHRSQDEPVPCSVCGKVFRNRILLMSHRRIHKQARNDHMSHSNSGLMTDNASLEQIHGSTHMDSGTLLNIIVLTDGNDC